MTLVERLDRYFWNEHTLLIPCFEPAIEEVFPGVWRWFELKDREEARRLATAGEAVLVRMGYCWLGIPKDAPLDAYLERLFP